MKKILKIGLLSIILATFLNANNDMQDFEKSNIKSLTYIVNLNGTIDLEIHLLSNELNSTSMNKINEIIKHSKSNKEINKISIHIDK